MRSIVYCNALRTGDAEDWRFLYTQFKNSPIPAEQSTILSALGCARNEIILNRFLKYSISEKHGIRKQDSSSPFGSVLRNPDGFHLSKKFFIKRIDDIHE